MPAREDFDIRWGTIVVAQPGDDSYSVMALARRVGALVPDPAETRYLVTIGQWETAAYTTAELQDLLRLRMVSVGGQQLPCRYIVKKEDRFRILETMLTQPVGDEQRQVQITLRYGRVSFAFTLVTMIPGKGYWTNVLPPSDERIRRIMQDWIASAYGNTSLRFTGLEDPQLAELTAHVLEAMDGIFAHAYPSGGPVPAQTFYFYGRDMDWRTAMPHFQPDRHPHLTPVRELVQIDSLPLDELGALIADQTIHVESGRDAQRVWHQYGATLAQWEEFKGYFPDARNVGRGRWEGLNPGDAVICPAGLDQFGERIYMLYTLPR